MRTFIVCALLALVPASSLRMVCLSAALAGAPARPSMDPEPSNAADADDDCSRICLRRPAAPPAPPPTTTCILVADPGCEYLTTTAAAVMPRDVSVTFGRASSAFEPALSATYLPPSLDRRSPPPKP
jgi:hypothetical protein